MPNAKSISSYSAEFQMLMEEAPTINEPFAMEFDSLKEARHFRSQWYGFIGAVEREAEINPDVYKMKAHRLKGLSCSLREGHGGMPHTITFTPQHLTRVGFHAQRMLELVRATPKRTVIEEDAPISPEIKEATKRVMDQMSKGGSIPDFMYEDQPSPSFDYDEEPDSKKSE